MTTVIQDLQDDAKQISDSLQTMNVELTKYEAAVEKLKENIRYNSGALEYANMLLAREERKQAEATGSAKADEIATNILYPEGALPPAPVPQPRRGRKGKK